MLVAGWIAGALVVFAFGAERTHAAKPATPAAATIPATPGNASTEDLLIPVAGVDASQLRDTFAQARSGGRVHDAIDILAPRGTPVLAAVDGTIRKLFTSRAGGITIYEFDDAQARVYYYAHLDRYASYAEGARVHRGDVIGYVGTTGNAPANTPHLHFAIEELPASKQWWGGRAVNPYPILTRRASEPRSPASTPVQSAAR
jgi:murein DD-endopeptidase MepM/ murein hydrolase activator NlpD